MTPPGGQFASDNYAGVCPEAWQAMELAQSDNDQAPSTKCQKMFKHPIPE